MHATLQSPLGKVVLGVTPLTIGSASNNQIVLNDPSVSTFHAEIHPEDQGYSIADLGSASGTFLNEERLGPHEPHLLLQGKVVRIGNTRFTYEVTNGSQIERTVSASSLQGSDYAYPSTMATPAGGNRFEGQSSSYAPPPPAGSLPNYMAAPAQPGKKRSRRGLWITLGSIAAVVVIAIVGLLVVAAITGPTPTKVLTAYCNDLKAGNYHAAYSQYSSSVQKDYSEAAFVNAYSVLGKPIGCTVSNVDDTNNHARLTVAFTNGLTFIYDTQVASDKINYYKGLPTPSLTVFVYCVDLENGNYQDAYNQLASNIQSQETESQFASSFGSNQLTACAINKVSNTAGSGTITATNSKGTAMTLDLALVQQGGTWKISSFANTPTEAMNSFCSALTHEDYATAYSDFSSSMQTSVGSADKFAAGIGSNKVTNCTASNVDNTAGKGTLSIAYADGSTQTFNTILVKQGDQWFIDSLQQTN